MTVETFEEKFVSNLYIVHLSDHTAEGMQK